MFVTLCCQCYSQVLDLLTRSRYITVGGLTYLLKFKYFKYMLCTVVKYNAMFLLCI